jgi:GNAT superfamily N-acetyltransferase
MDCLFLSEEARSHGIGESIMKRITKEAQAMGCMFIQWQTPSFNLRGINFYNRIGGKYISKERYFLPI